MKLPTPELNAYFGNDAINLEIGKRYISDPRLTITFNLILNAKK